MHYTHMGCMPSSWGTCVSCSWLTRVVLEVTALRRACSASTCAPTD